MVTKMSEENIEPIYQKTVDMLVAETDEYLNDSNYKTYETDTVRVPWTFTRNPKAFLKKLQRDAKYKVPKVKIEDSTEVSPKSITKPKFIEPKAAISSNEFFTRGSSKKIYIPVTYLGKPNPELDAENTK